MNQKESDETIQDTYGGCTSCFIIVIFITGHDGCDNEANEEEERVDGVGGQLLHTACTVYVS